MKIDFKQLAKVEKQYAANNQLISLNVLRTMINQLIDGNKSVIENKTVIESLKDLGILKDDAIKEIQQLNS